MVSPLLLLAVLTSAPAPVGVVQQGRCVVTTGTVAVEASVGAVLRAGDRISTDAVGWAEISLVGGLRLRLSAGTSVNLTDSQNSLQMSEGRLWAQRDASSAARLVVGVPQSQIEVASASSVVLEHTRTGGTFLVVRAGQAAVQSGRDRQVVAPGQALHRKPGAQVLRAPSTGGQALLELVAAQARQALHDPSGLQGFLRSRISAGPGQRTAALDASGLLRGPAEVIGADGDTVGLLVEEGLRPPPFFEAEVPTKGPNLEVQVNFP